MTKARKKAVLLIVPDPTDRQRIPLKWSDFKPRGLLGGSDTSASAPRCQQPREDPESERAPPVFLMHKNERSVV